MNRIVMPVLLVQAVALALLCFAPVAWAGRICPAGMVLIPGGTFQIGYNDSGYVEERSAGDVTVDRFCIDQTEITNAQFAKFVQATGYVTVAERLLSKAQFPNLSDEQ